MTGIDDDLATLRKWVQLSSFADDHAAPDRVEEEIARLKGDAELHRIELHHANAKRSAAEDEAERLQEIINDLCPEPDGYRIGEGGRVIPTDR